MTVFIPALETPNAKFMLFNYGALGKNSGEALKFILTHPLRSVELLFANHLGDAAYDGLKLRYYIVFGLSGGLLLFCRPAMLICLVPLVAKKMYDDDPYRWDIESYYGIETASILPALVFTVLSGFVFNYRTILLGAAVVAGTFGTTAWCMVNTSGWYADTKLRFYNKKYWLPELPVSEYRKALKLIPADASVSASGRFVSHLAYREKIYYFPWVNDAEYICATASGEGWPKSVDEYNAEVANLRKSADWEIIYEKNDLVIFRRFVPLSSK